MKTVFLHMICTIHQDTILLTLNSKVEQVKWWKSPQHKWNTLRTVDTCDMLNSCIGWKKLMIYQAILAFGGYVSIICMQHISLEKWQSKSNFSLGKWLPHTTWVMPNLVVKYVKIYKVWLRHFPYQYCMWNKTHHHWYHEYLYTIQGPRQS